MMFIAHFENTMRNAKFAPTAAPENIRSIEQIRREKRIESEERVRRSIEASIAAAALKKQREQAEATRQAKEDRRREILARIEKALRRYRDDKMPIREKVPVREILRTICDFHDVTVAELMARGRQRHMVIIRDEAIRAVADARPDMSLPEIGRFFDNRDHTTILHSLKKTAKPGFDYRGHALSASEGPA